MNLNKKISTPVAVLLVIALSATLGITVWQLAKTLPGKGITLPGKKKPVVPPEQLITVESNQKKYAQEESVKITLTNDFVDQATATLRIEKFDKEQQKWEGFEGGTFETSEDLGYLRIRGPVADVQIDDPEKFPRRSSLHLKWNPITEEHMFAGDPEKSFKRVAGPGRYRAILILHDEDLADFYPNEFSDEFVITGDSSSTLTQEVECEVERGSDTRAQDKFHKFLYTKISWNDYNNFSVKEATLSYGYGPSPIFEGGALTKKIISRDGETLVSFHTDDPRERIVMCEMGADCPPPQLNKKGEKSIINSLAFQLVPDSGSKKFIEANNVKLIEWYERDKLPEWASSTKKEFSSFKPGELLLRLDLSDCMKKFCEKVALENDPSCTEEYHSSTSKIKGVITDHQGNPVERVAVEFNGKDSSRDCIGSEYTNKNGKFIIDECDNHPYKLSPATYSLRILPPTELNLDQTFKKVKLQQGEEESLNISLEQCGTITGKVTDSERNPLNGWVYKTGFEQPRHAICDRSDCEPGTFKMSYLEPGTYQIGATVKIEGEKIEIPSKEVEVNLGESSTVNFVVEENS